jgi:two-component system phosphate regulon sensor histidine kinase PhoR
LKTKNSFFFRLSVFFLTVSAVLVCVFFIAAKFYIDSFTLDFFSRELKRNAAAITPFIAAVKENPEELDALVKETARNLDNRITVIESNGNVLADSQSDGSAMANHAGRDEVKAVLGGAAFASSVRYSSTLGEKALYAAVPVKSKKNEVFVLRLGITVKSVNLFAFRAFKNIFIIFIAAAAASFFAAYLVSRKTVLGIVSLSRAAENIARGDFKTKAEIFSSDEIGALAVSFNKMAGEIDGLFKELGDSKNTLDKVLASVSDGILLAGRDGEILLLNDAFKKNFPKAEAGRYVWEFLRDKNFEDALKNASGETAYGELEFENLNFSYAASKIKSEDSFVILLKDITKAKRLDNLKKEFITNASHELKTPLTSIAGFAEILETKGLPEEPARYIEIIKKQARRLSNIVNDLLSLSALESARTADKKETDISRVISDAAGLYGKKAAEKGLEIKIDIPKDLKKIYANEFNMEQLFVNLIDNAVKYTDKGSVSLSARNVSGDFVEAVVSDTGIGIPGAHIDRIFERFYVADKARSKKSGGTGLGLSIVKHILQINGGSVSVQSSEGKGSVFTVRLPAAP